MSREHDPPHIRIYDWPNVPQMARTYADSHDIESIIGVVVVPNDMPNTDYLIAHDDVEWVLDDDGTEYGFIH